MPRSGPRTSDLVLSLLGFSGRLAASAPKRTVNPLFDPAFYAGHNPHVVKGGIDLFEHYDHFGCRNGYDPNPLFRSAWYIAGYRDVAASGANPLDHYLERGAAEGRDPSPAFSSWLYLILYPDVREAGMNPLLHFLRHGRAEGRLAPPVCLVPALETMVRGTGSLQGGHDGVDIEPASLAAAQPLARALRDWTGRLLR